MTSPLTIAVALMTDGMAVPKNCGFSAGRSEWAAVTGGCRSDGGVLRASAALRGGRDDTPRAINHTVLHSVEKLLPDSIFP